jgi:hypothetical protein
MNEHDEYYLQDKRQMVGNSMYWWRKNGAGYCCDVREAHVYTREQAFAQHRCRDTDIPWPKAYIDARVAHHVDFQRVDLELARAAYSAVETSPEYPYQKPTNGSGTLTTTLPCVHDLQRTDKTLRMHEADGLVGWKCTVCSDVWMPDLNR